MQEILRMGQYSYISDQGWSNPIARRPGLVISEVGQVKIYLSLAHGQLDFSSPPVLNYYH